MKTRIFIFALFMLFCNVIFAQNRTFTVGDYSIEMVPVEGGTFYMGAQNSDPDGINYDPEAMDNEAPVHKITVSDFWISKYPVTQGFWWAVYGETPHNDDCAGILNPNCNKWYGTYIDYNEYPAYYVNYRDVQYFISALNNNAEIKEQITFDYKEGFNIPTEAQWEYAARGGKLSKGYLYAGSNNYDEVAWASENSTGVIQKIGQKNPNELGLYDMSGNVLEWCKDMYWDYPSSEKTDPCNDVGIYGVLRGGYYARYAKYATVSSRHYAERDTRLDYFGARLVMIAPIPKNPTKICDETVENFVLEQNLTGEILRLKGAKLNDYVKIFSIDGRQLYSNSVDSEQMEINISSFSSGIYVLKVGDKQEKFVKK